ncbi:MAG: HAMP domain-containing sensor histidine kinase [Bacteroidota bacterium]|nr:HAMP domain-containing sensor histidine kinase [Bacteroidota bacterium]
MKKESMNYELLISGLKEQIHSLENSLASTQVEMNHLKDIFLKHLPHEIRTPLNVITGLAYILSKNDQSVQQKELYTRYIYSNSEDLLTTIENLVDFSMIKSGNLQLNKSEFDMNELLDELYDKFEGERVVQGRYGVKLLLNKFESGKKFPVYSDPDRIRQILIQLLRNSLRFTRKGNITFGYYPEGDSYIKLYVKDTGDGIDEDLKDFVFDSFRKHHGQPSNKNRGLGMGLALVKEMVVLLGGNSWINSEKEKGSMISFRIPVKESKSLNENSVVKKKAIFQGRHITI